MIIYSTPKCKACKEVKEFLCQKNIVFKEVDMTKLNVKEQNFIRQKFARISAPLIDYKGKQYYSLAELKENL